MVKRDIKNGLYGWYEKEAMKKIESLPFRHQASSKLVYIAICSCSAKQSNTATIEVYKFDIARFASVSEKTVQRHLKYLEELEIIKVQPQDRKSNGKYKKCSISLLNNTLPMDTAGTRQGHGGDTGRPPKSDIYNKEIKKEKNKEHNNIDILLCNMFIEHLLSFNEKAKIPNKLDGWIDEFRKIRTLDEYDDEQLRFIITWLYGGIIDGKKLNGDSFWRKVILSPSKFREKLPQLYAKIKDQYESQKPTDLANFYN